MRPEREKFQSNPVIDNAVKAVLEFMKGWSLGQVLRHEELENLSGCRRYGEHWQSVVKKVKRKMLLDRSVLLWPVTGIGYKLMTRQEHLHASSVHRQKKAYRQMEQSFNELLVIPNEELSLHDQHVRSLKLGHLKTTGEGIRSQVREQQQLLQAKEQPPRSNVQGKSVLTEE